MTDELEPSDWTVPRARAITRSLIDHTEGRTYQAVEHFEAVCEYLDDLYGGDGFTRLLDPAQREQVAELISGFHRADPLRQPVNSTLTLDEGRELATLPETGELAKPLQGLYRYADDLYGGPGAFTHLLEAGERERVAALIGRLTRQERTARMRGRTGPGQGLR